jgi:hypothetical protein
MLGVLIPALTSSIQARIALLFLEYLYHDSRARDFKKIHIADTLEGKTFRQDKPPRRSHERMRACCIQNFAWRLTELKAKKFVRSHLSAGHFGEVAFSREMSLTSRDAYHFEGVWRPSRLLDDAVAGA